MRLSFYHHETYTYTHSLSSPLIVSKLMLVPPKKCRDTPGPDGAPTP